MRALTENPFIIKYHGGDADQHMADGVYLGQSIRGTARLYNSLGEAYFHGALDRSPKSIRVRVGPPQPGSITYMIYMMMAFGQMAAYP